MPDTPHRTGLWAAPHGASPNANSAHTRTSPTAWPAKSLKPADMDTDGLGDTTDTDGELIDDQVGDRRAGRLTAWEAELDSRSDFWAHDVGIDNGAASAEEAAVHVVPDTDERDG